MGQLGRGGRLGRRLTDLVLDNQFWRSRHVGREPDKSPKRPEFATVMEAGPD